jgi:hypothetical protein
MHTPYQRLKRLNDRYSLANVERKVVEHMRKNAKAVSMMGQSSVVSYLTEIAATHTCWSG